ncbi:carotenoid biosynthesis protein [Methylosinus sp. Sm6]|uniref:carotenoid biosynthesis protein n=1 Tax=Methylosinus sp. Sm6 TaxID=2866948 RepID=UPI001C98E8F0|nr:carotenoid biosynthesis protein [Methylosinus sp. Sm6]
MALIAAAEIALSWNPNPVGQTLAVLSVVIALAHGRCVYGWKNALAFFVITLVVTLIVENIGAATGVPFGHYHFIVTAGLPFVGRIPLVAGLLWFGMGYFSWQMAAILLDDADARLGQRGNIVALPLIAAFVMTQWDFVMDRGNSTLSGAWAWHEGGPDFGVPLSNYAGWFVTSWSFYQLYAIWLARSAVAAPAPSLRLVAVILYAAAGLTHLIPWLSGASGEIIDASGRVWRSGDIRAISVVVMLLTMLFSSTLAAIKIARTLWERASCATAVGLPAHIGHPPDQA